MATLTIRDDNEGVRGGWSHPDPDPACLFFSILKPVSFKKLNGLRRCRLVGMRKFPNPHRLHLIFVFIFYFLYLFLIFIILNLIYFIKK